MKEQEADHSQLATAVSDLAACEARIQDMESQLARVQQEATSQQELILGCGSPLTSIVGVQTDTRLRTFGSQSVEMPCQVLSTAAAHRHVPTANRSSKQTWKVEPAVKNRCFLIGGSRAVYKLI